VTPQFNGSTAVIESYLGHRIGLWNPSVYSFAAGASSPVTPLNQAGAGNDSTFYTGTPASFATRRPAWASRILPSSPRPHPLAVTPQRTRKEPDRPVSPRGGLVSFIANERG